LTWRREKKQDRNVSRPCFRMRHRAGMCQATKQCVLICRLFSTFGEHMAHEGFPNLCPVCGGQHMHLRAICMGADVVDRWSSHPSPRPRFLLPYFAPLSLGFPHSAMGMLIPDPVSSCQQTKGCMLLIPSLHLEIIPRASRPETTDMAALRRP
jgi:hypothetical protein